jgi:hypothetical protein
MVDQPGFIHPTRVAIVPCFADERWIRCVHFQAPGQLPFIRIFCGGPSTELCEEPLVAAAWAAFPALHGQELLIAVVNQTGDGNRDELPPMNCYRLNGQGQVMSLDVRTYAALRRQFEGRDPEDRDFHLYHNPHRYLLRKEPTSWGVPGYDLLISHCSNACVGKQLVLCTLAAPLSVWDDDRDLLRFAYVQHLREYRSRHPMVLAVDSLAHIDGPLPCYDLRYVPDGQPDLELDPIAPLTRAELEQRLLMGLA